MCRWRSPLVLLGLALLWPAAPWPSDVQVAESPAPSNRTSPRRNDSAAAASSVTKAFGSVISMLRQFPALEGLVLASCAAVLLMVLCLLVKVFRSRRKFRKTRKYDIITTPAEKVEMTPLNEEDEDEEDATVFDVKYSR
ncbi:membrane protein FAM174B [Narcine bancroftii]|uniref:membrane protein FAM174B n=1 Tax=Narcine bancroftii TaxID=1343680 RepID=UPI00383202C9